MKHAHSVRAVLARSAGIAAIVTGTVLTTSTAFAAPIQVGTPSKPVLIDRPMSGELANGTKGHFAFYMFNYPGAHRPVTIKLHVAPDDSAVLDQSGFKVYGPTKDKIYAQGGVQKGLTPNIAGDLRTEESGTYIIQVYNIHPTSPISYTLSIDGIPMLPVTAAPVEVVPVATKPAVVTVPPAIPPVAAVPAVPAPGSTFPVVPYTPGMPSTIPAPAVVTAPVPATAVPAPVVTAPVAASTAPAAATENANSFKGRLDLGASGHFATFEFNYPGDESVYTINLNMHPDDARIAQVAGFRVYGPKKDKVYLIGGYRSKLMPNVSGDLITRDPGTYLVQVYNYSQDTVINYEISLVPNPPAKR